ncbi:SRPBCC family protein [Alcanivorax sp. 1008]|uniref:SRPBCC family protein n=1 Tax=Alcanivorax sp. 1008 TaxID=2816853 RepID=UPI001D5D4E9B|nr:SRPBCC family protein [Alcanivorax sp. 1008]MCC1497658.1 SRPBCC family protein [Alcanivorax sp. 1008]
MPAFTVSHDYSASADQVWELLGDFSGLASWLPGVSACAVDRSGVGAVRQVSLMDGSMVKEELVALDSQARSYSYRIVEAPGITADTDYVATLAVLATDSGCRVEWSARFQADPAYPADKVAKAQARAEQMYGFCLASLVSRFDS